MLSPRSQVVLAFAAVYLIWGSTYLAIRFVIESIPPFFMASTRFLIAGGILFALTRLQGSEKPSLVHWRSAFIVGGLMLVGGHGAVVWAEQWLPSGLTSLLIATVPCWMVSLDSIRTKEKPVARVAVGLMIGFVGIILLVGRAGDFGASQIDVLGSGIVVLGALFWASGSLYSRSAKFPSSQLAATALEMLAGGTLLLLVSGLTGEISRIDLAHISVLSFSSWLYLIFFGSLIGFTSYIWLLKKVNSARVSTYAYVNPIVAMFLGWTLANETLTLQSGIAAATILVSVILITSHHKKETSKKEFS